MMIVRRVMAVAVALTAAAGLLGATVAAQRPSEATQASLSAEARLGAGLHLLDVRGDLDGSAAIFEAVAKDAQASRETRADALLALGQVQERSAQQDAARLSYERLRAEFGDTRPAAEAGRRLAALPSAARAAQASGDRVVWNGGQSVFMADGRVSRDGRYVVHQDYNGGDLLLQDLTTGRTRVLVDTKGWTIGSPYLASFSPDGRQVAYGWRTYGTEAHVNDIRIIMVGDAGAAEPRRLYTNPDVSIFNVHDWSADGRTLAVVTTRPDETKQIALVRVADGTFIPLKTTTWRGPATMLFSPDGRYLAYDLPASDDDLQRDVFILAVDGASEARVSHSANDVFMGWSPDGTHVLFASDRNTTVGLWALRVEAGKAAGQAVLLKPDIGRAVSLGLTSDGALHLVKDVSTRHLAVAPIDLDAGRLAGPPVVENYGVEYPTWSPDGRTLSYALTGANGIRVLALRSLESGDLRVVRPALEYFRAAAWMPDQRSVVVWGRDLKGRAGFYRVDLDSGAHTFITDNDISNAQVSRDGRRIYYTRGQFVPANRPVRFLEHDLVSGEVREIQRGGANAVGAGRLSPNGQLAAGFVGRQSSDRWGVVVRPVTGGEPKTIEVGTEGGPRGVFENQPDWTPDSQAVLALRALDGTPTRRELWFVPVDGRPARRLDIDVDDWFVGPAGVQLSPDGRRLTFLTGTNAQEVWRIESHVPALAGGR